MHSKFTAFELNGRLFVIAYCLPTQRYISSVSKGSFIFIFIPFQSYVYAMRHSIFNSIEIVINVNHSNHYFPPQTLPTVYTLQFLRRSSLCSVGRFLYAYGKLNDIWNENGNVNEKIKCNGLTENYNIIMCWA